MPAEVTAPRDAATPARAGPSARPRRGRRRRARAPKLLAESALIVLSVLLGFAATAWHDRQAERALAADAVANLRRELRQNLALLDTLAPKHAAFAARLAAAADSARPGETAEQAFGRAYPRDLNALVPPLADAAWETAVSTGALRLVGYERAARLSETYLVQRAALARTAQLLDERLSAPEAFEPARRAAMLSAYRLLIRNLGAQEGYLAGVYRATLRQLDAAPR